MYNTETLVQDELEVEPPSGMHLLALYKRGVFWLHLGQVQVKCLALKTCCLAGVGTSRPV